MSVFVGVHACVTQGPTAREGDMQSARGGAMEKKMNPLPRC